MIRVKVYETMTVGDGAWSTVWNFLYSLEGMSQSGFDMKSVFVSASRCINWSTNVARCSVYLKQFKAALTISSFD